MYSSFTLLIMFYLLELRLTEEDDCTLECLTLFPLLIVVNVAVIYFGSKDCLVKGFGL
jgi:hypothetical protein